MPIQRKYLIYLFIFFLLINCNLDKEIEIDTPDFNNGYVVESYLAPNQDIGILITRSYGFFEVFDSTQLNSEFLDNMLVSGVNGYIEVNGKRYSLINLIRLVPETRTIYNYGLVNNSISLKAEDEVSLTLNFPTGEKVTAETQVPEIRPIDSIRLEINDANEAREVTFLSSDSTKIEYFRRQLFRVRMGRARTIQDFILDNKSAQGGNLAFGSGFEFDVGDTLISRVTHMTRPYFDFYNSVTGSISANVSPFGQPGTISSNIMGASNVIGIFTGINKNEQWRIIEK